MIRGLHGLFYSSEPEAMREFMRDKLKLPFTDTGGGWLIFDVAEADIGVHPVDESNEPPAGTHDVSFYCDDINVTVAELRSRGVEFKQDPADHGYGFVTYFTMPGGVEVQLYQPKYQKATRPAAAKQPAAKPTKKAPAKQPAAKPARKAPAKQPPAKKKR
jgi:predicted enzyme related to lactoylglutathione lyase